jgi:hypothetical protein
MLTFQTLEYATNFLEGLVLMGGLSGDRPTIEVRMKIMRALIADGPKSVTALFGDDGDVYFISLNADGVVVFDDYLLREGHVTKEIPKNIQRLLINATLMDYVPEFLLRAIAEYRETGRRMSEKTFLKNLAECISQMEYMFEYPYLVDSPFLTD